MPTIDVEYHTDDGPVTFTFRTPTQEEWAAFRAEPNRVDGERDLAIATCDRPDELRALENDYPALLVGDPTSKTLNRLSGANVAVREDTPPEHAAKLLSVYHLKRGRVVAVAADGFPITCVFRAPSVAEFRLFRDTAGTNPRAEAEFAASICVYSDPPLPELLKAYPGILESPPFDTALSQLLGVQSDARKKK
jgi:hypothetical protein